MTSEIPVTEARAQLSDLINRVGYGGQRIVLTLVPAADLDTKPARADEPTVILDLSSQPSGSRSSYAIAAEDPSHPIQ